MKNKLILKTPASWWGAKWREALPAGNGTIGAAVYGAVYDETVLLTHEDLWHGARTLELPDVSGTLPEVRRQLFKGDAPVAKNLLKNALDDRGYDPQIGEPLPLGDLRIKMPVQKGFKNYRRTLDMETGEVFVSWDDDGVSYERRLFVSRTDNIVVMEIKSDGGPLMVDVALDLHDRTDTRSPGDKGVDLPNALDGSSQPESLREKYPEFPSVLEVQPDDAGIIRYAACADDGSDFGAVARIVTESGTMIPDTGKICIENAERILIVLKVFVKQERQPAWAALTHELEAVEMDYPALLAPHAAEHGELFGRVAIDLDAAEEEHALSNEELLLEAYQGEAPRALVEKMWSYGRYLLVSSSRAGGQPCHLLGLWCGDYMGFWAFNMANENLQMIYWQALSGAMPETVLPMFDYYDRMMDDFRENARKLYGCRGIFVPAVTTPLSGLLKTIQPHIIHWTGAAAWIGQHYYDYFLYTGDKEFLKNRALPFLREIALFYEDFFIVGEDGFFVSAPSNSPENTPGNYWDGLGMGAAMDITINATMDFALAKEVLTHLIEGAELTGGDPAEIEKWTGMRKRIPAYQINEDGAIAEWMHPFFTDNYHHRHQSHIYPVFPGVEITTDSDPELIPAFETAINMRREVGISEQTGWSLAHMANVYARMDDGDSALECLNLLARSCVKNNFYTTHNDWRGMGIGVKMEWAAFQIDANMGWSAAVQEMLLFSVPGKVTVLPALPKEWTRGSVSGMVARGGVRVSVEWDETGARIELCSQREQSVGLSLDGGEVQAVELKAGEPQTLSKPWKKTEPVHS